MGGLFVGLGISTAIGQSLRVEDPQEAQLLKAAGAKSVATYEDFEVLEFPADDGVLKEAIKPLLGPSTFIESDWTTIFLNTGSIDTSSLEAKSAQTRFLQQPSPGLFMVQLAAPPKPQWIEALEKSGARIVDYIPSNTYVLYGDANAVTAVGRLSAADAPIRWMGQKLPQWKISPLLGHPGKSPKANLTTIQTDRISVQMVDDKAANEGTLAILLSGALEPIHQDFSIGGQRTVTLRMDSALVEALAKQPDVISIMPNPLPTKHDERQNRIVTGQVTANGQLNGPGHMTWLANNGFTQISMDATNIVVDVTDSGIDNGTLTPNHFALRRTGVFNGSSRVSYSRLFGTPNPGSTIQGCDGHGTIQAHIIAGFTNNAPTTTFHRDSLGYQYGLGVNPFVRVGASVIFDPEKYTNPNFTTLASQAFRDGARISNNSWGAANGGFYNSDARAYDLLTRDAQPTGASVANPGNQQMLFVFSAGNNGPASTTIGTPATGKNVLTVGAQENNHPFGGADGCSTPDSNADNPEDAASFSSRGPTTDGRIKPDITAPGTHITGGLFIAAAVDPTVAIQTGTAATCFQAEGVCGGPGGNRFFPTNGQQFYTASSGTSHSAPAVTGVASLVYDWYRRTYGTLPSPAMAKAILMSTARWTNGNSTGDNLPSPTQGMGMVDANRAVTGSTKFVRDQVEADIFTASGQSRVFMARVNNNNEQVRLSLAWTDAAGSTSGNSFVNDLDLEVIAGGVIFRGNNYDKNFSIPDGTADRRNNVESVHIPASFVPANSIIAIRVRAITIAGDGIPNFGNPLDQDFALFGTNLTALPSDVRPLPFLNGVTITDNAGNGNQNNGIDPGESHIGVVVNIENGGNGTSSADGWTARLISRTNGVRVVQGVARIPQLTPFQRITPGGLPFQIAVDNTVNCGSTISFTLNYVGANGSVFASSPFDLRVGNRGSVGSIVANNIGLVIASDRPNIVSTTLSSPISTTIQDMEVEMNLTHTWMADLIITLEHPDGTRCILIGRRGGSGDNMTGTIFDDFAANPISSGIPPFTGRFRPENPLSVFRGKSSSGTWRVIVEDVASGDGGSLNSVTLRFIGQLCNQPSFQGTGYVQSLADFSTNGPFNQDLGPPNSTLTGSNLGNRLRNSNGLRWIGLQVNAVAANGPQRIFGVLENENVDLPYSAVGANRVVRARYSIAYFGPGDSASPTTYNLVPNFRLRAGMRFMHNTMLEVLHNSGPDQSVKDSAREFGPSTDVGRPSIYKVDYDPARVPQVLNDAQQGIQRGFEVYAPSPDYTGVNGALFLVDSSIGTYPRPDLTVTPVKTYATGGTAGNSDFSNPAVFVVNYGGARSSLFSGVPTDLLQPEPGLTVSPSTAGVTVNSQSVGGQRIGLALIDFLEGTNTDRTNQSGRLRVAPDELYVATFRVRSAGNSNAHPYMRFRMRTMKFQWNVLLEINGAKAVGSTAGQNLGAQVLPGIGNQLPGTTADGHLYHLFMPSLMDPLIRNDGTGTVAQRFPVINALPGPGSTQASVRDIKVGWDVIDSLSFSSGFETEAANNTTLNRIEIRRFTNPRD